MILGKFILSTVVIIGLNTSNVWAKEDTSAQLVKIASKQEKLSHNITQAYKKQDSRSALMLIHSLESGQKQLKAQIHNPEINNLIVFLNMCIRDLKQIVKTPYTSHNVQKVADLSDSISEGSHYIALSI